jgi:uncharacterized protein (TIGR02186 family)
MRVLLTILFVFITGTAAAQDQILAVDLAENHVDITTGFNGARLNVFGVQEQEGDIVIVITGPEKDMVVRRKEKTGGIWMNRRSMSFNNVPVYYDYALARAEKEIASAAKLKEYGIGMEALRFMPEGKEKAVEVAQFQDALIRNRQKQHAFPKEAKNITFISDRFFRATFYIPSNVATGTYQIKTFLIRNGRVQDVNTTDVKVAQIGTSAIINDFSHSWSFAYGMLCALIAVSIGWFSNSIRRGVR